jgi:hypothetical protein
MTERSHCILLFHCHAGYVVGTCLGMLEYIEITTFATNHQPESLHIFIL